MVWCVAQSHVALFTAVFIANVETISATWTCWEPLPAGCRSQEINIYLNEPALVCFAIIFRDAILWCRLICSNWRYMLLIAQKHVATRLGEVFSSRGAPLSVNGDENAKYLNNCRVGQRPERPYKKSKQFCFLTNVFLYFAKCSNMQ